MRSKDSVVNAALEHVAKNAGGKAVTNEVTDWEKEYTIKGVPLKMLYRGSPYNDIKVMAKYTLVPIARCVMSKPPDQAGAEKLVAPHWRKIKRAFNSADGKAVANAKFHVYGWSKGRIIERHQCASMSEAAKLQAELKRKNPTVEYVYGEDERNSASYSAAVVNARFKVGDMVLTPSGKKARVTSVHSSDYMMVHLEVPPYGEDEVAIGMCRKVKNASKDAVVNAALEYAKGKACNAKFKIGDIVGYLGERYRVKDYNNLSWEYFLVPEGNERNNGMGNAIWVKDVNVVPFVQGNYPAKYKVGQKGYLMMHGKPWEINGDNVMITVEKINSKKNGQKEPSYWCRSTVGGKSGGSMPVEESDFKPL